MPMAITDESGSPTRVSGALDVAVAATAVAAGVVAWMAFLAAPKRGEELQPFLQILLVSAVLVGLIGRRSSQRIRLGASLLAGPLLLAGPTASRGDGDGLWGLVFPALAVFGVGFALVALVVGLVSDWLRPRRDMASRSKAELAFAGAVVLIALASSVSTVVDGWPRGPRPRCPCALLRPALHELRSHASGRPLQRRRELAERHLRPAPRLAPLHARSITSWGALQRRCRRRGRRPRSRLRDEHANGSEVLHGGTIGPPLHGRRRAPRWSRRPVPASSGHSLRRSERALRCPRRLSAAIGGSSSLRDQRERVR